MIAQNVLRDLPEIGEVIGVVTAARETARKTKPLQIVAEAICRPTLDPARGGGHGLYLFIGEIKDDLVRHCRHFGLPRAALAVVEAQGVLGAGAAFEGALRGNEIVALILELRHGGFSVVALAINEYSELSTQIVGRGSYPHSSSESPLVTMSLAKLLI